MKYSDTDTNSLLHITKKRTINVYSALYLLCLGLCIVGAWAKTVFAYEEMPMEDDNFTARFAIEFSELHINYPAPEELFIIDNETSRNLALRLLLDAKLGSSFRFEFNGYVQSASKNKLQNALLNDSELVSDLNRISRFISDTNPWAMFFKSGQQFLSQDDEAEPYRTISLEHTFSDDDKRENIGSIDQLSLRYSSSSVDVTVGRQPIGLANNILFTPNDLFYPFASYIVDRSFRPGVDAVRIDFMLGDLSNLSFIGVAGYDEDDRFAADRSAGIMRAGLNLSGLDMSFLGGKTDERRLAGMALTADVFGLGLRMEGNYSKPYTDDPSFVQFSAGFDKRWENSLHLIVEYYHHGNSSNEPLEYLPRLANPYFTMDPFLKSHYLGVSVLGEPSPIFNLRLFVLSSLDDDSGLICPAIKYLASEETEFILSAVWPYGKRSTIDLENYQAVIGSEFGLYPRVITLQGRIYF